MILIVDINWKKNSLAVNEFVLPIFSIVQPLEKCAVKHFLDIKPVELNRFDKIILSGTALKDHAALQQPDKLNWIKTCTKPVLGICAGMETIGLIFGEYLTPCLQIGMTGISTVKENPLFEGNFKAYTLHNYAFQRLQKFEVLAQSAKCIQAIKHKQKNIFGVLFHPEVRNQSIVEHFVHLKS